MSDTPSVDHLTARETAILAVELDELNPYHPAGSASENGAAAEIEVEPLRTRGVKLERVRPIRWLWARRVPLAMLSLLVAEEGIGKGTLASWVIARATRGELEGDMHEQPTRVLVVGDEDAFDQVWVPRLYAAGADLDMLRTLDDGELITDFASAAPGLIATIEREQVGLLLLDALIDHIPGGMTGEAVYNPKNVRQSLMPLRRVAAATEVAALGLLHPIKGNASSFRQLIAGSHQFNAVSRSSLLLAADPADEKRRVLVRGKGNHTAEPRSVEFAIVADVIELNGHTFEVPKVVNLAEGERTARDLLGAVPESPVRDALAEQLSGLLTEDPKTLAALALALGRSPKDGSVRNALNWLHEQQRAKRIEKGWVAA